MNAPFYRMLYRDIVHVMHYFYTVLTADCLFFFKELIDRLID